MLVEAILNPPPPPLTLALKQAIDSALDTAGEITRVVAFPKWFDNEPHSPRPKPIRDIAWKAQERLCLSQARPSKKAANRGRCRDRARTGRLRLGDRQTSTTCRHLMLKLLPR